MTSPAPLLTGKQLRHLRSLAHSLKPVVLLGKNGWTDAVRGQIDEALLSHELIKIKLGGGGDEALDAETLKGHLQTELGASIAQEIGHVVLAYRRHPKKPIIDLPRETAAKR